MRFVLVDRVLKIEPGAMIEARKNVAASEDVFVDHFPGWSIFPGALLVEAFEQAAQLLIGTTYGFARTASLTRLSRVGFRRFIRPGDQLTVRCERQGVADDSWTVAASAMLDGVTVASGRLEFALEDARAGTEAAARANRYRDMLRLLQAETLVPAPEVVGR
jgi:3-hydroxyacyl-[acyl-carrier-protein] dehydratase